VSERIEIWTDGGCQGNPGPGAWAFVLRTAQGAVERAGYESQTTNNRMELTAVREALTALGERMADTDAPIVLSTDSQYVQKGITQWIHAWSRNGWKTSAKKPVKNKDLWAAVWELSRGIPIQWVWVEGHAGNEMNEVCHSLVEAAIEKGLKQGG
jgi:ribonuclease HI